MSEEDLLTIFEGVPIANVMKFDLSQGLNIIELISEKTNMFPSKGEARRMIAQGGLSLNKEKISDPALIVTNQQLLNDKYILFQKGKKSYFLVIAS